MLLGDAAGLALVAHQAHDLGGRADEGEAGGGAGFDEGGVLREQAEAGVQGVGAGLLRGGDDPLDVQVALAGRGAADVDRTVALQDVEGAAVGVGVDGDGLDAEGAAGAGDADGDLAAVGDEKSGDGCHQTSPGRRRA